MPNLTPNLNLKKTIWDKEPADIRIFNENMDIIDEEIKKNSDLLDNKKIDKELLWETFHKHGEDKNVKGYSNIQFNQLGLCSIYYSGNKNLIDGQPTDYGQLINIPADKGDESTQLWLDQMAGRLFARKGNSDTPIGDQKFLEFANVEQVDLKFDKAGGTIKGPVEIYGDTPFIDFHNSSSSQDYTTRIIDNGNGLEYWKNLFKVFSFDEVALTKNVVSDVRLSGLARVEIWNKTIDTYSPGRVICGVEKDNHESNIDWVRYATLQKKVGNTWYTVAVE